LSWYIGQQVKRIEDDSTVIYRGIHIDFDNPENTCTHFEELNGRKYTEPGGVPEWYKTKYIELRNEGGEIIIGNTATGEFFR
jgi:hypothetical protein